MGKKALPIAWKAVGEAFKKLTRSAATELASFCSSFAIWIFASVQGSGDGDDEDSKDTHEARNKRTWGWGVLVVAGGGLLRHGRVAGSLERER
ncbi:unnamed protein product, partial [Ilex paraguariensis]